MERFSGKIVVVTGGAKGIGERIATRFQEEGATVEIIDKSKGDLYVGDVGDKTVLEDFARFVTDKYGKVDILVNNALPIMKGIKDATWEDFIYAQKVGVAAPFYLAKLFRKFFTHGSSIINISSTRDRMSQPETESYTAVKGGMLQQPSDRIGKPDDIASMVLFLCSDEAGFITGENIVIDGGMTKQMIYHGEYGWTLDSKSL